MDIFMNLFVEENGENADKSFKLNTFIFSILIELQKLIYSNIN